VAAPMEFSATRWGRAVCFSFLIVSYVAVVFLQWGIDQRLSAQGRTGELLYATSGKTLRRLCLGHEGLLADIYWTRVVQYFGRKRLEHSRRFDLLGPLLSITTDLDPQLIIAYRFGAIFLAEKPPGGAGRPEEALQLLRRGIVANPDYWRLWQDLGFIYYWDLKDYPAAARAFQAGSERPGAEIWMKVLAASVAAGGGALSTSRLLWSQIYREAANDQIRKAAEEHLIALQAQEEINQLNSLLAHFRNQTGRGARSWAELVLAGHLREAPRDPTGVAYRIGPDERVALGPGSKVDLRLLQSD